MLAQPVPHQSSTHARSTRIEQPAPLREAVRRLRQELARHCDVATPFHRIEHALEPVDALAWLETSSAPRKVYWRQRDAGAEFAGTGVARCVDVADAAALPAPPMAGDSDVRYFVTGRFDPERPAAPEWQAYGAVRSYLPALELRHAGGRCTLACNVANGPGDGGVTAVTAALDAATRAPAQPPDLSFDTTCEATAEWRDALQTLLTDIDSGQLKKVVLARRARHRGQQTLPPLGLLRSLAVSQPRTYLYCVQIDSHRAFIGASPERLYRRQDRNLSTEALAGTRSRGADDNSDRQLAAELLASDKERREHRFVLDHLQLQLAPLCDQVDAATAPSIAAQANVQHLRTAIDAHLSAGTHDTRLLSRLHPTPAVCGLPTTAARQRLREIESFDRGLFAGFVGCLGRDAAEFAVAIRCALIDGPDLTLFAGAGIVAGSDVEAEWRETANKMAVFTNLAGDAR